MKKAGHRPFAGRGSRQRCAGDALHFHASSPCAGFPGHLDSLTDDARHHETEHVFAQRVVAVFLDHLPIRAKSAGGNNGRCTLDLIGFAIFMTGYKTCNLRAILGQPLRG